MYVKFAGRKKLDDCLLLESHWHVIYTYGSKVEIEI